jgi:hypothetical protein
MASAIHQDAAHRLGSSGKEVLFRIHFRQRASEKRSMPAWPLAEGF